MPVDAPRSRACALVVAALLVLDPSVAATRNSAPVPEMAKSSLESPPTVQDRVRAVVAAVCSADEPAPDALTLSLGGAIELSREPLRIRDRVMGVRHSLMLPDGARIRIDRLEPEGILRRVVATYAEPSRSGHRPVLLALAGSACNVMAGRRLVYYPDGMVHSIEFLESNLERAVQIEPLNPPVPAAAAVDTEDGSVRVAHGCLRSHRDSPATRTARSSASISGISTHAPSTPIPPTARFTPSATGPAPRR